MKILQFFFRLVGTLFLSLLAVMYLALVVVIVVVVNIKEITYKGQLVRLDWSDAIADLYRLFRNLWRDHD